MTRTILTDIEGTITYLAFVKETLFPYSKNHLEEFILSKYGQEPKLFHITFCFGQAREWCLFGLIFCLRFDGDC